MDGFNSNKKYEAYIIPGQQQFNVDGATIKLPQSISDKSSKPGIPSKPSKPSKPNIPSKPISLDKGLFYEIEYDSGPMPGVGKFVLKPQRIQEPEKDEKRELFGQMREIARAHRSIYDSSRFFDQRVQNNNAIIFYKQAKFMKDFIDNYSGNKPFTLYFPSYQMMGYEQLRTYFSWRADVRQGNVADISLSYVFLYIYELLANIGVSDSQDGLNKLMSFWRAFGPYNKSIDKYVLRWLKDYHIYYELPHSFKEFIDSNNLTEYYPNMVNTNDSFELFCNISKYDIRESKFFTEDNMKQIKDCFSFVTDELRQTFQEYGIDFNELIFRPTKKMAEWKPFRDALFYNWKKQADRRIVFSEKEIYICHNNKWFFNTSISSVNSRQLIGYIMKQMEAALRKVTKYKFKLSTNINTVTHEAIDKLERAGLSLETIINDAVARFYEEETKTVVIVDQEALSRIRQEALVTQEKLIIADQEKTFGLFTPIQEETIAPIINVQEEAIVPIINVQEEAIVPVINIQEQRDLSSIAIGDMLSTSLHERETGPVSDVWASLKNELTPIETEALSVIVVGETDLKKYADECGIMLEVLIDGINEKAMDLIGDNLLDEEFVLYDDYKEEVKELIR